MKKNLSQYSIAAIALFCLLGANQAYATKNVSGAVIKKDKKLLELRTGYEMDDRRSIDQRVTQQLFYDYGVTDRIAVRATGYGVKLDGDEYHVSGYGIEGRYEWIQMEDAGYSLTTRARYQHYPSRRQADVASLTMMAQTVIDQWHLRANAGLASQTGDQSASGLTPQLAAQANYQIHPELSVGGEYFINLGRLNNQQGYSDQQHQLGPELKYNITPSTQMDLGYLVGVSKSAPDSLVKLFIRHNF